MSIDNQVPPPPSDASKPSFAWDKNFLARAEEQNWSNEDVLTGQLARNQLLHLTAIGWVVWLFIWLFAMIFLLSLVSWVAHQIAPECFGEYVSGAFQCKTRLHWLTDEQLSNIQSVIFSGALGALVTAGANKFVLSKD